MTCVIAFFQITQLKDASIAVEVEALKQQLISKSAAAAQLQKALENSLAEQAALNEHIEALSKQGDAAGKKQVLIHEFAMPCMVLPLTNVLELGN